MPAVSFPIPKVNQNIFLFFYSVFYMTITQTFKHIILTLAHKVRNIYLLTILFKLLPTKHSLQFHFQTQCHKIILQGTVEP